MRDDSKRPEVGNQQARAVPEAPAAEPYWSRDGLFLLPAAPGLRGEGPLPEPIH